MVMYVTSIVWYDKHQKLHAINVVQSKITTFTKGATVKKDKLTQMQSGIEMICRPQNRDHAEQN